MVQIFKRSESIITDPPGGGNCETDEDSGEEDGGGTISNFNPHQLTVPALVKSRGKKSGDHPAFHGEALQPDNGRC